jgi:ABC-type amino acid transport substrate-binding protein
VSTVWRVGFDHPFQPFAYMDGEKPRGTLIEQIATVMETAGLPLEWVPMTLDETEPALFSGRVHALGFKGITQERLATMEFSAPLVVSGAAVFRRPDQPASDDPKSFAGKRAVTPRRGPLAAQFARDYPEVDLATTESYETAFDALLAGRAEIAALNFHAGIQLANDFHPGRIGLPSKPYAPLPIAFAVAKGRSAELLRRFDEALRLLRPAAPAA